MLSGRKINDSHLYDDDVDEEKHRLSCLVSAAVGFFFFFLKTQTYISIKRGLDFVIWKLYT